ncbi:MAG: ribonuclease HII [Candidatus Dormibacteria bacterium]
MSLDVPEGACGMDEVGRGALAGPLVAAAVILPAAFRHPLLRDSKLLTALQRDRAEAAIRAAATAVEVVEVSPQDIDLRGVGWANRWAFEELMRRVPAPLYLVDGNLRLDPGRPHRCIPKGDRLVRAISAASIVAKVHRDRLMVELDRLHPRFGWRRNKGYGSRDHLEALREIGPVALHRTTFVHLEPRLPL